MFYVDVSRHAQKNRVHQARVSSSRPSRLVSPRHEFNFCFRCPLGKVPERDLDGINRGALNLARGAARAAVIFPPVKSGIIPPTITFRQLLHFPRLLYPPPPLPRPALKRSNLRSRYRWDGPVAFFTARGLKVR